jgi:ABC-2 type transport system permease protein
MSPSSLDEPLLGSPPEFRPPSWLVQVHLLTGRVLVQAFLNPVLLLNLLLALLFLLVYDGTVGGLQTFLVFSGGNYYNFILPAAILAASQTTAAANLIFIPLIFFSPLLVPYTSLKPWMQTIADVNPTRYVMEGMRSLIIDGWSGRPLLEAFGASLLFGAAMAGAALFAIRSRLLDGHR